MKWSLLFMLGVASALAQAPAGARQVYLMPMAGGLDQYLATWLTREHVLQVVTDPKVADVILTDRIGTDFEQQFAALYPPEKKPAENADKAEKKDEKTSPATGGEARVVHSFHSSASRGTVFLVDTKTRQVVWSDHEKPVQPDDAHLNREAERIVKKLAPPPAK
jgi:hypothetical protein